LGRAVRHHPQADSRNFQAGVAQARVLHDCFLLEAQHFTGFEAIMPEAIIRRAALSG
jgi:hypothetical protein